MPDHIVSCKSRRRTGLSLVECLIATLVLTTAAGAGLTAISASCQQSLHAQERRVALRMAEETMERILAARNATAGTGTSLAGGTAQGTTNGSSGSSSPPGSLLGGTLQATPDSVQTVASGVLPIQGLPPDERLTADGRTAVGDVPAYHRIVSGRAANADGSDVPAAMLYVEVDVETPGGRHVRLGRLIGPD